MAAWIADLTNSRLREIWNGASDFFADSAKRYMAQRMEEERAKAVETSILSRVTEMAQKVERATAFRSRWPSDLLIAVAASFVFAVIVLLGAAIYRDDLSIFALVKEWAAPPAPVQPHLGPPAPGTTQR